MRIAPNYTGLAPIFQQYCIERVSLFGSRARNEATYESDYDFLVDFSPKASLLDWGGLVEDLMAYYGRSVDVVSRGALADGDFQKSVMKDARVIYEAN